MLYTQRFQCWHFQEIKQLVSGKDFKLWLPTNCGICNSRTWWTAGSRVHQKNSLKTSNWDWISVLHWSCTCQSFETWNMNVAVLIQTWIFPLCLIFYLKLENREEKIIKKDHTWKIWIISGRKNFCQSVILI